GLSQSLLGLALGLLGLRLRLLACTHEHASSQLDAAVAVTPTCPGIPFTNKAPWVNEPALAGHTAGQEVDNNGSFASCSAARNHPFRRRLRRQNPVVGRPGRARGVAARLPHA